MPIPTTMLIVEPGCALSSAVDKVGDDFPSVGTALLQWVTS